jgi:hypothetical protein
VTALVERKRRQVREHNVMLRDTLPYAPCTLTEWQAEWERKWHAALLRNPVEPRLTCHWQLLEHIEEWAVARGWYRSGFGPNGQENGFNVFFRRRDNLELPERPVPWAGDELNGELDDV